MSADDEIDEFDDEEEPDPEEVPSKPRTKREIADEAERVRRAEFYRRERWHDGGVHSCLHPGIMLRQYDRPWPGFDPEPVPYDHNADWALRSNPAKLPPLTPFEVAEWIAHEFDGGTKAGILDSPTVADAAAWLRYRMEVDGASRGRAHGGYDHNLVKKKGGYAVVLYLLPQRPYVHTKERTGEETRFSVAARGAWVTFETIASHILGRSDSLLAPYPYVEAAPDWYHPALYWLDWANDQYSGDLALVWHGLNRAANLGGVTDPDHLAMLAALGVLLTRESRCHAAWGAPVAYKLAEAAGELYLDICRTVFDAAVPEHPLTSWGADGHTLAWALRERGHGPEERLIGGRQEGDDPTLYTLYEYPARERWYATGEHRSDKWAGDAIRVVQPDDATARAIIDRALASVPAPTREMDPWRDMPGTQVTVAPAAAPGEKRAAPRPWATEGAADWSARSGALAGIHTDWGKRPARKAREGQLSLFGDEGAL